MCSAIRKQCGQGTCTELSDYVGRFAPSPSGDLHFGSLVTALASFLRARQRDGVWLLRIDDIDSTRCKPAFSASILTSLEQHGLHWDRSPIYQSQRLPVYDDALEWLASNHHIYYCECTRKQIKATGLQYTGTCRDRGLTPELCQQLLSVRLKNPATQQPLADMLGGPVDIPAEVLHEDFILKRRDGLHAYHLVSVVDDIEQGVTEVVRGADLLLPSACQAVLYDIFSAPLPVFLHIPVAISQPGRKLSKQNLSPALDNRQATKNLLAAGRYLGADIPNDLQCASPEQLLEWLTAHWNWLQIPPVEEKLVESHWC